MINILLVEEQRLFSEGIRALISTESDMNIIGMVSDKREILSLIEENDVHVVLINTFIDTIEGIKLTVHISENYPETKVIHYTSIIDEKKFVEGVLAGADAILLQNIDAENLIQSIRNVHRGHSVFSGEAARILAKKVVEFKYDEKIILGRKFENRNIKLTSRELDVAYLLTEERSNQCIAKKLHLSEGTVKNYVSNLYSKLHINDREEMVKYISELLSNK